MKRLYESPLFEVEKFTVNSDILTDSGINEGVEEYGLEF